MSTGIGTATSEAEDLGLLGLLAMLTLIFRVTGLNLDDETIGHETTGADGMTGTIAGIYPTETA